MCSNQDLTGKMTDRGTQRRSGMGRGAAWLRGRMARGAAIAMSVLGLAGAAAAQTPSYVAPLVSTANTTLYSTSTAAGTSRVSVDKAGNVFYLAAATGSTTLMELPAGATTPVTLVTGLGQYNASATFVDVNGNLWVSDGNGTATTATGTDYLSLIEIPAVNGIPNVAAIASGGTTVNAIDATHCGTGITAPCTWQNYKLNTSDSAVSGPQVADLYVDGSGNVYYISIYDNTSKGAYNSLAKVNLLTGASSATTLATNLPHSYNSQITADAAGNVYYLDGGTGTVSRVSGGTLTTVGNTATLSFAQIASATGITTDQYGNLYIASGSQLSMVPFEGTALNFADEFVIVNGLGSSTTNAISYGGTVDAKGNYTYVYNASATGTKLQQLQINSYNFGSVPVGTLTTGPTLTLFANQSQVMSSYFITGSPTSNTNASLLQSFPYSGTKSFSGGSTLAAGTSGTIVMNFQPVHPGLLKGSYTPRNNGANEAVINLLGTGVGPQAMFLPGTASVLFSSAATSSTVSTQVALKSPMGLAVDTYNDVFVADSGNGKVVADCLSTTTAATAGNGSISNSFCGGTGYLGSVVELGTGFTKPAGIALDGANNLYVTDAGANSVTEISGVNLASNVLIAGTATFGGTALNKPSGIAVDGYTNLYIADSGNNRVVKAHQYGATITDNVVYVPSTLQFGGTALSNPSGVDVDSAGNLFIADTGNNRVVEYSATGVASVISTTGLTLNAPTRVKAMPSGTLLVTDAAGLEMITNGTGSALPLGSNSVAGAQGLAVDLAGNVYVSDTNGGRVLELNLSTPPAVSFASTPQGGSSATSTLTVQNSGNAMLSLSAAPTSSSSSFVVLGTSSCANGSSVTAGTGSCTVVTNFTPQATGPLSGSVTLTDNQLGYTLNTTGSSEVGTYGTTGTQAQALSGTGTAATTPAATPVFSPVGGTYTSKQTVTISTTTSGATIYYTTDGSTPTTASTVYSGAITVGASETIKAIAVASGFTNSSVATATYTINLPAVKQPIVVSQLTWLGALPSGGFLAGGSPLGGSFAVTQQGNVVVGTTYGSTIVMVNGSTGAVTNMGSFSNPGGVTIDANNNLYISHIYSNIIYKIPYVNGAYVPVTDPTSSPYPPYCTGTDTVECQYIHPPSGNARAMSFDANGNFYMVTTPSGTGSSSIYVCLSTCSPNPNATPTLVYADANTVGSVAADQNGNVFFTDAVFTNIGNLQSTTSALNEIKYSGGAYATTPIVLATYSNASPSSYDDALGAVGVDSKGTVYFSTQYNGMFAFPNNAGVIDTTQLYGVSPQGSKGLEVDASGNLWIVGYHGSGDTVGKIGVNNIVAPSAALTTSSTTSGVTIMDNALGCSSTPKYTFATGGTNPTEFSAAASGSCAGQTAGSDNGATVTFTPAALGTRTATLTVTDSAGNSVTANLTGIGTQKPTTPQTITFTPTSPVSYTTTPITLNATASSGLAVTYTVVSGPATVSGNQLTLTGVGTVVVAADQAGNSTYAAAPEVKANIVVNQASNTITFTPVTTPMSYTTTPITLTATSSSGLPVTFSVLSGPGTVSGNQLTVTGVGTIVVAADQAGNANYVAATEVTQSIVVTQASQTITFTQPTTPVTYSTTPITLTATASSGLPVTFSIVSGPGTISGNTLTLTNSGTVVIAANQAGNANYSAATQVTRNVVVNAAGPAATPTFSPKGGTYTGTQTVTISDTTPGAVIYYTTNGALPTTSSTVYTGPISVSQSEIVQAFATAPGYTAGATATASYTIYTGPASFTIALNPTSMTIPYGMQQAAELTVTPVNGFNGTVTFACAGVPSGATCSFTPATVTPTVGPEITAVNIVAPPRTADVRFPGTLGGRTGSGITAAFALCLLAFRRRRGLRMLAMVALSVAGLQMLTGCGNSTQSATTSTVTITATSGSLTQTASMQVTIQP